MVRQGIFMLAAAFHFIVIIMYNVVSTATGYESVYDKEKERPRASALIVARHFLQVPFIRHYARYSGAETGFGFFAPQVGSQFISVFRLYDAQGNDISEHQHPDLLRKESLLRYSAFLDLFQDMLFPRRERNDLDRRYARAVVFSMGERLGKRHRADQVDCRIFLYRAPRLSSVPMGRKARLVPVYKKHLDLSNRP